MVLWTGIRHIRCHFSFLESASHRSMNSLTKTMLTGLTEKDTPEYVIQNSAAHEMLRRNITLRARDHGGIGEILR